ncbi:MAG: hypothetical protein VX519_08615 [Myxococcota bacterium]|nr:hypothetical protein [Myxococcota bacterium]
MARAHVEGLRTSDAVTLQVLAGDLLRYPLCRLDPRSLCDLLALSESEDLPVQLTRDLQKFRQQMLREYNDLPEGEPLVEFLRDLRDVDADRIPESLRSGVVLREDVDSLPLVQQARDELLNHFEKAEPAPVGVGGAPVIQVERVRGTRVPQSAKERAEPAKARSRGPARRSKAKTPVDTERFEWVREDVLSRLSDYPERGLKQAMLVAGARHRAPWKDLKEQEVVSVLKALEAGNRVRLEAGRWVLVTRFR